MKDYLRPMYFIPLFSFSTACIAAPDGSRNYNSLHTEDIATTDVGDASTSPVVVTPDIGIPTDMIGNGPECSFSDTIECIGHTQGRSLIGGDGSDPFQGQFDLDHLSWTTPSEHSSIEGAHFGPNGIVVQAGGA